MTTIAPLGVIPVKGFENCEKCQQGDDTIFRVSVKDNSNSKAVLLHIHQDDSFQAILVRLCKEYPAIWHKEVVYYFYIDMGGLYHTIDDPSWLRDKDTLIVTDCDELTDLPTISLNAVHASLRPEVKLRSHQVEGVNQMIYLERSKHGGILADDMGLGKTIQTLTVILRQQPLTNTYAGTLVIVPSRGIGDQWAEEIRTKTTYGSLPYFLYQDASVALIDQPCFRVIISTYDRVRNEYKKRLSGIMDESPLFDVDWHRIVLDESHKVRGRTMLAQAVTALKGKYKWCLSGTPFQNDVTELYPIFHFLGIRMDQRRKTDNDYVMDLLKSHMIRRTKAVLHKELTILPRQENRITLQFSPPERALYDYLERMLYHQLNLMRNSGDRHHHVISAAILYLRLKQVCGHHMILIDKFPDLIPTARSGLPSLVMEQIGKEDEEDRKYWEEATEYEQAKDIIQSYYDQFGNLQEPIDLSQLQKLKFIKYSTKFNWLIRFLKELMIADPTDKIIVVSQFVDTIIKIAEMLSNIRIPYETYHGSMSPYSRRVALQRFNHDPKTRVMIMSLKAGGVGLNLQRANHMIILDRWWNPATMDQAISRIHRMTQQKETFIHTVVIQDTIEEALMDSILNKKNLLFQKIVERENVEESNSSHQDAVPVEKELIEVQETQESEEQATENSEDPSETVETKLSESKEQVMALLQEDYDQSAVQLEEDKPKRSADMTIKQEEELALSLKGHHDLPEDLVKLISGVGLSESVDVISNRLTGKRRRTKK